VEDPIVRAPEPSEEQPQSAVAESHASWVPWLVLGGLFLAAAGLTMGEMFPNYYKLSGNIGTYTPSVWFAVPAIAGWLLAGSLVLFPRTRTIGAALGVGVTVLSLPNYLSHIGDLVTGGEQRALGVELGLAGIAIALVASAACTVLLIRSRRLWVARDGGAPVWALLCGILGLVYGAGYAMSWTEFRIHATVQGWRFNATGTSDYVYRSFSLFHRHGWTLAGDVLLVVLAALVPVIVSFWAPGRLGAAATFGCGLALLANPLSGVAYLAEPVTRVTVGMTAGQAQQAGAIFSDRGLPGLWMSFAAAGALMVVAVARGLYASSSVERSPRVTPAYA
jgi:hypothetical protein